MERRSFLKGLTAISAGLAFSNSIGPLAKNAQAKNTQEDFGEVKSIKIECISETGWFDNSILGKDVKAGGGINASQYEIAYNEENLGGYAALIDVEALDGKRTRYLLDSGWSNDWMDYVFGKSGVDKMLQDREIETMVISHDHNDHYFGIESTLKHQPDIKIYFPSTAMGKSIELLHGADFSQNSGCPKNAHPHTGELILTRPDTRYKLQDGGCLVFFDIPITLGVRGENVLFFKIKDKGYVIVTGCGHPGIMNLLNYANRNFKGGRQIYGCYGGLHIAPFENWTPKMDDVIAGIQGYKMEKIACNHCTGRIWAKKAIQAGLPIVKGTDKFRSCKKVGKLAKASTSNLYTSNGDTVVF